MSRETPLLAFDHISFGYQSNGRKVLHALSLEIQPGTVTAILGPNGAGKTTLLHLALGWLAPQNGLVRLNGQPLSHYSRRELGQWMALVPQSERIPFDSESKNEFLPGKFFINEISICSRSSLLLVLKHPELPLHNNASELGVRRRVRKRDVSFGPRTEKGRRAWDTFMTLAETARKLGVSFYAYLRDRITGDCAIPPLAELVTQTANLLCLRPPYPTPSF